MSKENLGIVKLARDFLYECPGGMDPNKDRDKHLDDALEHENKGVSFRPVVENVLRAAFFQGQAVGQGSKTKTEEPVEVDEKTLGVVHATLRHKELELMAKAKVIREQLREIRTYIKNGLVARKPSESPKTKKKSTKRGQD